jgi:ABC-type Na+ efflux pump permease subunit
MSRRAVTAIVRRDLARVRASRAVVVPLIIVPLLLLVVVPLLLGLLPRLMADPATIVEVQGFVTQLPEAVLRTLPADPVRQVAAASLLYLIAPLYLIVPLLVASVIAADSFAGERERGTLELLLNAPTSDAALFFGKVVAAWIPAVAVAIGGACVYGVVANLVSGSWLFPNLLWTALALWVAPAVALLGLGVTVLVSSRVRGAQEANQIAGLVVLPFLVLMVGQAAGFLLLSPLLVLALGAVLWLLAAGCLAIGVHGFSRTQLGERL